MLKNYLKIAVRNMRRYKIYSLVNIAGLTLGMSVCFLILLWVADELSFDRYHKKSDRIHRICVDLNAGTHLITPLSMPALTEILVKDYPEIVTAARIERPRRVTVRVNNDLFFEEEVCYGDSSLFQIFSFPFISVSGDSVSSLDTPYTVVVTKNTAEKYFKDLNPVGKTIKIENEDYTITGVVENVPMNSHFRFNIVRSFKTLYRKRLGDMENWLNIQYYAYLLMADEQAHRNLEAKLANTIDSHMGDILKTMGGSLRLFLQPLKNIHLQSKLWGEISKNGDISIVRLFALIAFFILGIACFNFINLTTARTSTRLQEIGVRKTLGSTRRKLIFQFIGESVIYSMVSFFSAALLLSMVIPNFHSVIGRSLSINVIKEPLFIFAFLGLSLLVGVISGIYPAFYLSSFQPVRILKKGINQGQGHTRFRNILVTLQFAVSIVLIVGSLTIYYQIHYMKNRNLGLEEAHVLVIPEVGELLQRYSLVSLREEFLNLRGVLGVSGSSLVPGKGIQKDIVYPEGYTDEQPQTVTRLAVDENYLPLMLIKILAGRNFSSERGLDESESLIINETTAKIFGWKDPLGKTFRIAARRGEAKASAMVRVIGVIKDFHSDSLHDRIEPLLVVNNISRTKFISLRIAPETIAITLNLVKEKWKSLSPDRPFDYFFLDDLFNQFYGEEERMGKLSVYFSLVAVILACLGLFSLSSFITQRRTKEIGIRKAFGASVSEIVRILSTEFIVLAAIANLVAWPAAYYGMQRWLSNFAYRIPVAITPFLLAGALTLLAALISVCIQTVRAAWANPAESLRYE